MRDTTWTQEAFERLFHCGLASAHGGRPTMTYLRPLLSTVILSTLLLACAGDPVRKADDAHDAEMAANRRSSQAGADQRGDAREKAAEVDRQNSQVNATGPAATKDRTSADAKLTEARAVYRSQATEKLDKIDARTAELKAIVGRAGAKASTASHDALATVDTQHGIVAGEIEALPRIANDDWDRAKNQLDKQLDTLDGVVKRAAKEVDKLKK